MNNTKLCSKCGISKPLNEFSNDKSRKDGLYLQCKECDKEYRRKHSEQIKEQKKEYRRKHSEQIKEDKKEYYERVGREKQGSFPMHKNKDCPQYLGIIIGEYLVRHLFKDVEVMPHGNIGFDFVCNKGKKIDVKTSCTSKSKRHSWGFHINHNTTADYFICVAFDNRADLNPLHIWMMPGSEINRFGGFKISLSTIHKWDKWKMDINDTQLCCNEMKNKTSIIHCEAE